MMPSGCECVPVPFVQHGQWACGAVTGRDVTGTYSTVIYSLY